MPKLVHISHATRHMLCLNLTCKVLHLMTSTTLQDLSFGKRFRVFIKSHYQKFQKIRRWLMLRFLSNFMEYRVSSKSCASVMSILCHQKSNIAKNDLWLLNNILFHEKKQTFQKNSCINSQITTIFYLCGILSSMWNATKTKKIFKCVQPSSAN